MLLMLTNDKFIMMVTATGIQILEFLRIVVVRRPTGDVLRVGNVVADYTPLELWLPKLLGATLVLQKNGRAHSGAFVWANRTFSNKSHFNLKIMIICSENIQN